MNDLSILINNGNDFTKTDIQGISDNLFKLFTLEFDKETSKFLGQIEQKSELLKLFLEILNKTLYSDLVESKQEKLTLIDTISKLKHQQELLEILSSGNIDNKVLELLEISERFGKKAQSSVKLDDLDDSSDFFPMTV